MCVGGGGEVSREGCQARLSGRPSCPFQSTPPPAPSQQAHTAAAGTTQHGPPLAPVSPSSGEVEFNLFFPDGPSQTSTWDPDPPQPEPMTSPEPSFSPCSFWRVLGKSCHKPCSHPTGPSLSLKPSCQLLRSQPTPTERHPTLWVGSHLHTGQAAG